MDAVERMQRAYRVGNQAEARAQALGILRGAPWPAEREAAEQILTRTEPDAFLSWVGYIGLGLSAWLVYNYVL